VDWARIGAPGPRRSREVPIRAAIQEEEEQYQGGGGEGPDPAWMRRTRGGHLQRGHVLELRGTGMPNLSGIVVGVRVCAEEGVVWELGIGD
jgi:hypothetical protein